MLIATTPPTSKRWISPGALIAQLDLTGDDAGLAGDLADEVSDLFGVYLGYECAYGVWQETIDPTASQSLYLGARPIWSVTSVTGPATLAATDYRLERPGHLYRAAGWSASGRVSSLPQFTVNSNLEAPWVVTYTAGWWLETMSGTPPAGVEKLPAALRADAIRTAKWQWAKRAADPTVRRWKDEGSEMEYHFPQDLDMEGGLPRELLAAAMRYRRAK
jgi:hypothetical protein